MKKQQNSIPKSKIRNLLEKLKDEYEDVGSEFNNRHLGAIMVLEELLKED